MYSISMAIVDYVPVFIYGYAMVLLRRFFNPMTNQFKFVLLALGSFGVFFAGFFKATYKLLIALHIAEVPALSNLFLPMQAVSFLLCGLFVLLIFCQRNKAYALAAPFFLNYKMLLVALMVAGVLTFDLGLAVLAAKRKSKRGMWLFILACFLSLMMGYLSGKDFTLAVFNWIAEIINTLAQLFLLLGSIQLLKTEKARKA